MPYEAEPVEARQAQEPISTSINHPAIEPSDHQIIK